MPNVTVEPCSGIAIGVRGSWVLQLVIQDFETSGLAMFCQWLRRFRESVRVADEEVDGRAKSRCSGDIIGLNVCGINSEKYFPVHGGGIQGERMEGGLG